MAAALPFVVGGCSAMLASAFVHPVDLTKVRLQLFKTINPSEAPPGALKLMSNILREEGVSSLYRGLSAALLRQALYGTARIGLHRTFSNALLERNNGQPLNFGLKALSGMGSGSIAVCVGTPMDVVLVRRQADSMKPKGERRGYTNVFNALFRIASEEGTARLYSGLAPNILRGMSMNVGQLACYDQAKELIATHVFHDQDHHHPCLETQLAAACVAGFTASFASLPFDLIKSRLQDGNQYKGLVDCFTQVVRKEGFAALWTSFGPYYLRTAPHAMIILMSTAPLTKLYKQTVM